MPESRSPWWLFVYFCLVSVWWNLTQVLSRKSKEKLPSLTSYEDMETYLVSGDVYKADPLGGLLDVAYHVTHSHRRLTKRKGSMDCEDHGLVWIYQLLKSRLAVAAYLGTVWYRTPKGYKGHAVCVFQTSSGKWLWVDYTSPRLHAGGWDWGHAVSREYGGKLIFASLLPVKGISSRGRIRLGIPSVHKA